MNDIWIWVIPLVVVVLVVFPMAKRFLGNRAILKNGDPAVAQVLAINQTGTIVNDVPMMRLKLRITQADASREVTITQLIDLGNMPRIGEKVYVMIDRTRPDRVAYGGLATGDEAEVIAAMKPNEIADVSAIPDRLLVQGRNRLGIATILDMKPGEAQGMKYTLEVDSVVEKKRIVTIAQMVRSINYDIGDRAYIFTDASDPALVALVPLAFTGGAKIPKEANRLDALVLGPQILHEGKKGTGTVTQAVQVALPQRLVGFPDASRWHLRMRIVPEDGSTRPYEAEQTITFTLRERAERICKLNATVPIRYDWNDPQTFVTDPLAMGYPDPYKAYFEAYRKAMDQATST